MKRATTSGALRFYAFAAPIPAARRQAFCRTGREIFLSHKERLRGDFAAAEAKTHADAPFKIRNSRFLCICENFEQFFAGFRHSPLYPFDHPAEYPVCPKRFHIRLDVCHFGGDFNGVKNRFLHNRGHSRMIENCIKLFMLSLKIKQRGEKRFRRGLGIRFVEPPPFIDESI